MYIREPPNGATVLFPPSTTVAKKLLGRTISADKRVILDARRVNLKCPKIDYWPLVAPTLEDLARRYCSLGSSAPGIWAVGTKRDIESASTRCRLRPGSSVMFGTEFSLCVSNGDNILFFYLDLPFGFTGSPGIFGRLTQAAQWFHRLRAPPVPSWNEEAPPHADVFAGDGMFIELTIGDRPQIAVETWGRGARLFRGLTCISERKLKDGGPWEDEALLGSHVNLKHDAISLPNPEITGAPSLINLHVFDRDNLALDLHFLQELRGRINHWSYTDHIWRRLTDPINRLMSFSDSNCVWIRCNDLEKWQAFWNAIQFIREISADPAHCSRLRQGFCLNL